MNHCPDCGKKNPADIHTCSPQQPADPVVGTKTWFEDGRLMTRELKHSDVYKQPADEPVAITEKLAYAIGAAGGEPTEAERLLFEAWMRGHCWAVVGGWDGKTYVHSTEINLRQVHPGAMRTRLLWAAWRDRAALSRPQPAVHNDCARSHPHENMDAMCELRTEIARLTNENARLKTRPAAQPIYGWVRMNGVFNSGVFHLGETCPPGWVGAAEPVTLIVAAETDQHNIVALQVKGEAT